MIFSEKGEYSLILSNDPSRYAKVFQDTTFLLSSRCAAACGA